MKRLAIAGIVALFLAAWHLLFPPGLQPGRNTIYFVVSTRVFTFYVSRPDASWVPRWGFTGECPFPTVTTTVTLERLHSYKPPDP